MSKLSTYWNTIKYLRFVQLRSRLVGKFRSKQRVYYSQIPSFRKTSLSISDIDEEDCFCDRFYVDLMKDGKVCLLNELVKLDYSYAYTHSLKPLTHNNVYYFEYAIALASKYKKTGNRTNYDILEKCYENYLQSDANVRSSYIMALHIPNMLIALEMFGDIVTKAFEYKVYKELYSQYRYLESHVETHLLANHYFEDLKALTIASFVFKEDSKCLKYLELLHEQVKEQILPDGAHYELSPMYHKLIMEDLLRIATLSKTPEFPKCDWTTPVIQKMASFTASLEKETGVTPLFNDGGDNVAKSCDSLIAAVKTVCNIEPVCSSIFADSGYYKIGNNDLSVIIDCGKIGVDYQPAHGHCDCLSFELSYKGIPLFVNQGTYEYQGYKRGYFRRTCAHNTLSMDGHEQSQCWGGFRVGKRISNVKANLTDNLFEGKYTNVYGQEHSRRISLVDNCFVVEDATRRAKDIVSYLHISPSFRVEGKNIFLNNEKIASIEATNSIMETTHNGELSWYAPEFGKLENGTCIIFKWKQDVHSHGYKVIFL